MSRIAIIPARACSKRIPGKNILPFMGKPMLAWTVEAALETRLFDCVLVSTDSEEIAEIARQQGAEVPFLREGKADDFTPVSEAVLAALSQAEDHWGMHFSTVAQLMPTCPLRTSAHVSAAMTQFDATARQFQISVFRYGWMNPWWAMRVDEDGQTDFLFEEARSARSQDLSPLYCPSGAVWIARRDALIAAETFYGPGHAIFELPWQSAVDIDNDEDLAFARATAMLR